MIFLAPVDQENKFTLTKNIANHICKNLCLDPDPAKKVRIQNIAIWSTVVFFCKISFPLKRNENLKTEAKRAFKKNSCTLYTYLCESTVGDIM